MIQSCGNIYWLFNCLFLCAYSQIAGKNYVSYVNYSAVDYGETSSVFSPTVDYCMALANAKTVSNGFTYHLASQSCILLETWNNQILIRLKMNLSWTTYVKHTANVLQLLARYEKQLSVQPIENDPFRIWTGSNSALFTSTYTACFGSMNNSCASHYRNPDIDYWHYSKVSIF